MTDNNSDSIGARWNCECSKPPFEGEEVLGNDGAIRCPNCGRPLSGDPEPCPMTEHPTDAKLLPELLDEAAAWEHRQTADALEALSNRLGRDDLSVVEWNALIGATHHLRCEAWRRERSTRMEAAKPSTLIDERKLIRDSFDQVNGDNDGGELLVLAPIDDEGLRLRVRDALLDTGINIGCSTWPDEQAQSAEELAQAAIEAIRASNVS